MIAKHGAPALIMVGPAQATGIAAGALGTWREFADDPWYRPYVPAPQIAGLPEWGRIGTVIEVGSMPGATSKWEIRGMVDDQVVMRRRTYRRLHGEWEYMTAGPAWFARFDEIKIVNEGQTK